MDFNLAIREIPKAYFELGHHLGFRFLLCPKNNFNSEVLFLGLNPGGNFIPPDHPSDSCEEGPAHMNEIWKNGFPPGGSPLQVQMKKLFNELNRHTPGEVDWNYKTLISYFIPFRSPNFASLHQKENLFNFLSGYGLKFFLLSNLN